MTRKENWRQEEISALVEGVSNRLDQGIKEKFSPFITSEKKANAWEEVLERRSTIRQEKGEHFLDFVRKKTSLKSLVDPRTFVYDLVLLSDGTSHTAICEVLIVRNCSFDVILFRMSEQNNSSSSDLIGLANFSLLGDDFDFDLIPTQKLVFQRKEKRYGAQVSGEDLHKKFVESVPKKTRTVLMGLIPPQG
uniref:Uncharacterized protein n=1 Tax=Magallana gigas TaxID=29159 RepID=A0A8W8P0W3_MAGGI